MAASVYVSSIKACECYRSFIKVVNKSFICFKYVQSMINQFLKSYTESKDQNGKGSSLLKMEVTIVQEIKGNKEGGVLVESQLQGPFTNYSLAQHKVCQMCGWF